MKQEIIYEKKYPKIDYRKEFEEQAAYGGTEESEKKLSSEEFMKGLFADIRYIPIPKRIAECERFINEAIRFSELYELNLDITRYDDCVRAHFSFDFFSRMKYINHLFGMADEISFFRGNGNCDISMELDFYTHVLERHGFATAP